MIERYQRPEMKQLWGDESRFNFWLDVELAALEAMAELGQVPVEEARTARNETLEREGLIDPERIREIERTTRHDVIAFLTSVEEKIGPAARPIHKGLTSSDVVDTALAMMLKRATELIEEQLDKLLKAIHVRALEHKMTLMIGRTHGVHAEPTTFGLVMALWYAEMSRHRKRLAAAKSEIAIGKLSGAVGTYANTSPTFEKLALDRLGLSPEPISNQVVQRDRHATFFNTLAVLACSIEKCALQIRHWQRTEVGEAEEKFHKGQKGSSAMPHKRNPVLSENLTGLARLVRSYAGASLENVALWHERDISHSSVERVIGPDATSLVHFMLHRLTGIAENLVVNPDGLLRNLNLLGGVIYSQRVLLKLIEAGVDRQQAYVWVQKNAMAAREGGASFQERLCVDPQVGQHLSAAEVSECFDPLAQLQHVDEIFERVFGDSGGVSVDGAPSS